MPSEMTIEHASQVVAAWASEHPAIQQVWVFGSRVRGNARPHSDLDVAVALGESAFLEGSLFEDDLFWLSLQSGLPMTLDLQWYFGPTETPILHRALLDCSISVYRTSLGPQ